MEAMELRWLIVASCVTSRDSAGHRAHRAEGEKSKVGVPYSLRIDKAWKPNDFLPGHLEGTTSCRRMLGRKEFQGIS